MHILNGLWLFISGEIVLLALLFEDITIVINKLQ